jgi:intracellular septation protein A
MGLALSSGFILVPFREGRRFTLLLAPACGLLILTLAVAFIFSMTGKPLGFAIVLGFIATAIATMITLVKWRPSREEWICAAVLLVVVGALATMFGSNTTIRLGAPGILFLDGSDHAGYAHLADWFLSRTIHQLPVLSPKK